MCVWGGGGRSWGVEAAVNGGRAAEGTGGAGGRQQRLCGKPLVRVEADSAPHLVILLPKVQQLLHGQHRALHAHMGNTRATQRHTAIPAHTVAKRTRTRTHRRHHPNTNKNEEHVEQLCRDLHPPTRGWQWRKRHEGEVGRWRRGTVVGDVCAVTAGVPAAALPDENWQDKGETSTCVWHQHHNQTTTTSTT